MICCPLQGNDDGDGPSCFAESTRTARKEHACSECDSAITKGAKYLHESGVWDGVPGSYKTCLLCVEIRNHFACSGGWLYGCLWSDLRDNFFPDMKCGGQCMEGLSPAAKQKLIDERMTWYFAQDEINDDEWDKWPLNRDRQRPIKPTIEREENVPWHETPEYYWKRELELDQFRSRENAVEVSARNEQGE